MKTNYITHFLALFVGIFLGVLIVESKHNQDRQIEELVPILKKLSEDTEKAVLQVESQSQIRQQQAKETLEQNERILKYAEEVKKSLPPEISKSDKK